MADSTTAEARLTAAWGVKPAATAFKITRIGLPSRPVLNSEGRHFVADGKKGYAPTIEFRDRDTRDRFAGGVLAAVHARWPRGVENAL